MSNSYKDFFNKAQTTKGVRKALPAPLRRAQKETKGKKSRVNPLMLSLTAFGFLVTVAGTFYFDEIERFLRKIDIGVFARAAAEEATKEKTKENKNEGAGIERPATTADAAQNTTGKQAGDATVDEIEINHFARLRERKKELDKREEDLNKLEVEIAQQRQEVEQKLKELEDVRRKISSVLEEKVQIDEQKVENLVQFYSNMKAPQAAKIVETIDEGLAVQVIAKMKKKNAADIMNLLKPEKAQAISEKYVGYRK